MHAEGKAPVQYDRPPIMEVACGIAFNLPKPIKSGHVGLYWARVADHFPRCEDAPPIGMVVEAPDGGRGSNIRVELLELPELRRTWLLNAEGTHLIQLQEDRFIFNWKRTEDDAAYPSYQNVIQGFRTQWANYERFLVEQGLGEPTPVQLDLTYFNMLVGLPSYFKDHVRVIAEDRFLPEPEAINWRSQFPLPNGAGRLHVTAISSRHLGSGRTGIRLDLTARGLPKDVSAAGCEAWFTMAHEWITQGFTDLTTPEAHIHWGRTA